MLIVLFSGGKYPFGQLPVLEVEGVTLCQSMTILRFVATRHGKCRNAVRYPDIISSLL